MGLKFSIECHKFPLCPQHRALRLEANHPLCAARRFPSDLAMKAGWVSLPSGQCRGLISDTPGGWPDRRERGKSLQVGRNAHSHPGASSTGARPASPGLAGVAPGHGLQTLHSVVGKTHLQGASCPHTTARAPQRPGMRWRAEAQKPGADDGLGVGAGPLRDRSPARCARLGSSHSPAPQRSRCVTRGQVDAIIFMSDGG